MSRCVLSSFLVIFAMTSMLNHEDARLTLNALVLPKTSFYRGGQPIKFALYGFLELQTLDQLFAYIDMQVGRWQFVSATEREEFAQRP